MKGRKLLAIVANICLVLVIAVLPFVAACAAPEPTPTPAPAKAIELSFNTWCPNTMHPLYANIIKPWADELEGRTEGRVEVTIYLNYSLAGAKNAYDAVQAGVCDISGILPANAPERFPLVQILTLPLIYPSGEVASRAWMDLYNKYPQFAEEFSEVKVLWLGTNSVGHIMSVHPEPVRTLEDMKGMVFGEFGAFTRVLELLGATSDRPPTNADMYAACEKKVYDGVADHLGYFRSTHLEEVIRSITLVGLQASILMHVMNLEKYDSFPADIQNIIDEVSKPMGVETARMFDKVCEDTIQWLEKDYPQIKIYTLPAEEKERWARAVEPLWSEWVASAEALGYPGRQMLDDYIALCKKYTKK